MHQANTPSLFSRIVSTARAFVLRRERAPLPWCGVIVALLCSVMSPALAAGSGAVIAWGDQGMGQSDALAGAGSGVTQVAGGYLHSVALKSTGAVLAWGSNASGQCTVPAGAASGVTQIASGLYHSMALKSDGSVLAWGYNGNGASTVPAVAKSAVTQISGGYAHSVAVKSNGSIVAWGSNSNKQAAVPATAATGMKQVSAGVIHNIALKSTGAVLAWGDNANGQCTVPAAATTGVTQVAAGYYHSLALKSNGSVIAWGSNAQGQTDVPRSATAGVTQIVGSYSNSLARKADGSVIEWGDPNSRVALLPTASRNSVIQVGAGGFHGLAVVAAPVISSLTPASGSTLGGTTITITGTDLAGTTQVKVGGVSATGIVATATSVKAVTAASTAGVKNVAVTTAGGTATRAAAFTSVVPLPAIASVSPATGPASGGTAFTINGSNLNGATSVKVGGVAATALVISATSISGKTPIGAAGAREVSVTTAGGTATKAGAFVYVASPTIASVSPSAGPLVGGTTITIAGANLAGAKVAINGVAATIVSATAGSISAKTPIGTAGAKSVVVTTVGGAATKAAAFTYVSAPTIASVSPGAGPLVGGTTITITGANLAGAAVTVDGKAATSVVATALSISAKVPAGTAGAKNVVVTTAGGAVAKVGAFTYVPVPTIAGVSPSSGPLVGGTSITITGTNLVGAKVTIDGKAATGVVASAASISATVPAGTAGAKSVVVTTVGGVATRAGAFTYVPVPTIASVSPSSGPLGGGTAITIAGANLAGGKVTINGVAATIVSATAGSISAKTPAGTAGAKSVVVTTVGGATTKADAFTYVPVPTIASVSPSSGPLVGGTAITIAGANLAGAKVTINGVAATIVSATAGSISAKTPAGTAGAKSVVVTTVGGAATKAGAFTYVPAPTIASVSPSSGPLGGGTAITIAGANLAGAKVTINGVAATIVSATAGSISAKTPAGTAGAKSVVVTTVGGSATKAGAFTYVPAPTIAGVSPSSGPVVGGTSITISGANLAGATVTIDGKAATSVVASASLITARTPAGAVGAKSVLVTTVGGVATKLNGFTYTSSFTGDMPVAGGDSGAPARGAGSEHASAGHRGGDAAGAAPAATDVEGDAQVIEAPMGVQRYLQVITIRSEGDVSCDTAPVAGSSVVDAAPQDTVDPVDLDQNGEADLCQLRRGDLDLNGTVDQFDVAILMELVGSDPVLGIGDLDGDGSIDNADIALLLTNFA